MKKDSIYPLQAEESEYMGKLAMAETKAAPGDGIVVDAPLDKQADGAADGAFAIANELAKTAMTRDYDAFADQVSQNMPIILMAAKLCEDVAKVVVYGYRMGVEAKNALCANNLGALYYGGNLVEQDYQKAADLYEMAMDWGNLQSAVNLGYIYEYGRVGEPDYQKAFSCYSFAAALGTHFEALYKLGDMYARGRVVSRDIKKAYYLWEKSYEVSEDAEEESQAAFRIAKMHLDGSIKKCDKEPNYLLALMLFQKAELGLRISVSTGATYYENRLQEAIRGQEAIRELL